VLSIRRKMLFVLGSIMLSLSTAPAHASGTPIDRATLVGAWDYTTYTMMRKGKPAGTVQFKPRTMVFTYTDDGIWQMQANDPTHTHRTGTYDLHGSELVLKNSDGSPYQDFQVEMRGDGRSMLLRDDKSVLTTEKLDSAQ
jgi:hypothetical protein